VAIQSNHSALSTVIRKASEHKKVCSICEYGSITGTYIENNHGRYNHDSHNMYLYKYTIKNKLRRINQNSKIQGFFSATKVQKFKGVPNIEILQLTYNRQHFTSD